jgi:hypothetical protein
MNIRRVTETLSDGSKVCNIVLSDGYASITLCAVDRNDAAELAQALAKAIAQYTVHEVRLF